MQHVKLDYSNNFLMASEGGVKTLRAKVNEDNAKRMRIMQYKYHRSLTLCEGDNLILYELQ